MKTRRTLLALALVPALVLIGCEEPRAYGPPPPPAYAPNPLLERAEHTGFHMGEENGERDANNGWGYHPRRERAFHDTPGYDPALGPYGPYRDTFRNAYLRGYDHGFHHP
ncbi:MAG: hypothetical protein KGK08_00440 [Acidobacteriota bacterium]|nr:hypothetical protein [Acidobacteriota bacterium]